jgi:ubiquinone/menaquinone biosynthesis C-methylase UbiE
MDSTSHQVKLDDVYRNMKFPQAIDCWAAYYARDETDIEISNARHFDEVRRAIENDVWRRIVPPDGTVLDLACGRGFFSRRISDALDSPAHLFGVDLSFEVLRIAHCEQEGLLLALATAELLPFRDNTFDVVLLITAIQQMEDTRQVVAEIHRVLKHGGHLYLCLHKPYLDPFVIPRVLKVLAEVLAKGIRLCRKRSREFGSDTSSHIGCAMPLRSFRRTLHGLLLNAGFERIESRAILHRLDWSVYKALMPWAIPTLLRLGGYLNRLPLNYYKDLEYWLLRKP